MIVGEGVASEAGTETSRHRLGNAIQIGSSLLQAAVAVAVWLQQNAAWRRPLFIVLALGAVVPFWPLVKGWFRQAHDRFKDWRVARREYARFENLVSQFRRFVDHGTSDTLHYIVDRELSERFRGTFQNQPGAPAIDFWYHSWLYFNQRLERKPRTLAELTRSIPEFRHLVSSYYNYCVAPVFERWPPELRSELNDRDRRLLSGFQQSHALFVQQYDSFIRQFAASRPALKDAGHSLQKSKPL